VLTGTPTPGRVGPRLPDPRGRAGTDGAALAWLARAWTSPTPTVMTGRDVDIVQTTPDCGALAAAYLQPRGCGAVFLDGDLWHFFVPSGSDWTPAGQKWPATSTYLSGQRIAVPHPQQDTNSQSPLRWHTHAPGRGSRVLTSPVALLAVLLAVSAPTLVGSTPGPYSHLPGRKR
jgi:hypothetical protein